MRKPQLPHLNDKIHDIAEYFPANINFIEPEDKTAKEMMFDDRWPEEKNQQIHRSKRLIEEGNQKIMKESEYGQKSICLIIVTHADAIDITTKLWEISAK